MAVYTYPQSKVIDEIIFRKTSGGAERAYLHAASDVDGHKLHEISAVIRALGWQMVPFGEDGKPMLEVRGFKKPSQLISALQEHHFTTGEAVRTADKDDRLKFSDKLKKRSLFASGWFYILGDLKFISYGIKGSTPLNTAAGGFYGAGTLSSLLFGRRDPSDLQIHEIADHMAKYMNEQRFSVPPEASVHQILKDHKKGKIKQIDDVLRRYPAELMNSFFALAGVCIAIAAYRKVHQPIHLEQVEKYVQKRIASLKSLFPNVSIPERDIAQLRAKGEQVIKKFHRTSHWLDVGLGSMTFASGMFANLVKEKIHDPDDEKKHGIAAMWEWIQERPMTIAGVGYMVSTLCHAASTGIEWHIGTTKGKEAIFDRGIFVGTNLIAELLVAMSSKGHGQGVVSDKSVDNTAIALAADLIVKQPAAMQNQLIDYIGNFLGRKDTLAMKNEEAHTRLREQVEAMRKNPWAAATASTPPVVAPVAKDKEAAPAWQAKIAAQETAAASPQLSA